VSLLRNLQNTQYRADPSFTIPQAWVNMSEAVLTQNVKLFDPMDTGYVDSREFMVALLLDGGVIKPPNMDELTALIGNFVKGDQENDGNQRMDYNEMTTVEFWFENSLSAYMKDNAATSKISQAPEDYADIIKAIFFHIFSSKSTILDADATDPPRRRDEVVVVLSEMATPEMQESQAELQTGRNSSANTERSSRPQSGSQVGSVAEDGEEEVEEPEPDLSLDTDKDIEGKLVNKFYVDPLDETMCPVAFVRIVDLMVYLCFDDEQTSGRDKLDKALSMCPTTKGKYTEGAEKVVVETKEGEGEGKAAVPAIRISSGEGEREGPTALDMFLERVKTSNKSRFVKKDFVCR